MSITRRPRLLVPCTNVYRSNYRAKDRLGLTLVPIAVELDNDVPVQVDEAWSLDVGISSQDWMRARVSAHWMVRCTHM